MRRRRVILLRGRQEPPRRLTNIDWNAGAGGIKTADYELRSHVAKFGSPAIPMSRLHEIGLDALPAGIEFRQTDDGRQIVLLGAPPQIRFSLIEVFRQALALQVHERGVV